MVAIDLQGSVPPSRQEPAMTTSNPNAPQPAGADPAGEDRDRTVDPLVQPTLRGAVPDEQTGASTSSDRPDPDADGVDDDRRASGAEG
jgi:hypothetical protein